MSTPLDPKTPMRLIARLARLLPYFGKPYSAWILVFLTTVVMSLTEPMIPALMKPLLDKGFTQGALAIWMVPVALIGLFGVRGLASFSAQVALAKVTNNGMLILRRAMFDRLLDAKLALFRQQSSSALANTLVYEVQTGSMMLVNALTTLVRDSLTLVSLVGYLLYLNWKLTLIVTTLFPAVAFVMRTLSRRLYRLTKDSQQATDELAYVVEENVLAHRDVRLQAAQASQAQRFNLLGESMSRLNMKSTTASAAMTPLTQMLAAFALSAVISVALVQSAGQTTSVGGFAAFVSAMLMLIAPIKHLSELANPITRGLAALERGLDLIALTPSESGGSFAMPRAQGHMRFKRASVIYPDSNSAALERFDFEVQPGETIAIVGASGSGKTTLVNLLPRFVELSSGSIELDGVELAQWDLQSLRAQFALVSQHVLMLNDSIAVNIALGQEPDRERVTQCLRSANLADLIADLPQGIDTIVGHNAMQLSGGQRQRLAIARALYKNAPILILDEATSALDTESERAVQEALQGLMQQRTTLVIAHRLSTIQHAQRIVVMAGGRMVECGSHAQLLAAQGTYAQLYQMGFAASSPTSADELGAQIRLR